MSTPAISAASSASYIGPNPSGPSASSAPRTPGFPSLIQTLLQGDDASQTDTKVPDSGLTATDPANPFVFSLPDPQAGPAILPLVFSTMKFMKVDAAVEKGSKAAELSPDPSTNVGDAPMGATAFLPWIQQPIFAVPPPAEPAGSAQTPAIQALPAESPSDRPDSLTELPQNDQPVKSSGNASDLLEPLKIDIPAKNDANQWPQVRAELTKTATTPLVELAFQARLIQARPIQAQLTQAQPAQSQLNQAQPDSPPDPPAVPGQTLAHAALSSEPSPIATLPDGRQSPGDQQDSSPSNFVSTLKPQAKASAERRFDSPEDEPAAVPSRSDAVAIPTASSVPMEHRSDPAARAPENPHTGMPVAAEPEVAPPAAPASTPIRDLSFRITSASSEQVELKVQDKGGEIRVAVHSNSPELSADLRQQVGDLVSKLDRTGFHTEVEKPQSTSLSAGTAAQPGDSQGQDSSGQPRQQQQDKQQQDRQQPKEPNLERAVRNRQPEWLQAMDGILATTEAQGVFNR